MKLDCVFSPIDVGPVRLSNRIARAAHGTGLASRGIGADLIAYHEKAARGGVGLIVLEIACVHRSAASPTSIPAWDDSVIAGYEALMDVLGAYDVRVFQQLWHGGHHSLGFGGSPPWCASSVPAVDIGVMPVAMTHAQIDELVEAYAAAAARARNGGLHGVEVHAAHGYLLNQFLSPLTNRREDEYGGSLANRLRFPLRVVESVREAVGRDLAVGVRLNGEDGVPGGLTNADMIEIAETIEATGAIDYVSVSLGNRWAPHRTIAAMDAPHGYELPTSVPIARAVEVPAIVTGRIVSLARAEEVIASGMADIVSMVRAMIADPGLVLKTREGHIRDVRPCVGCNHGCFGGLRLSPPRVGCAVNPGAGRELTLSDDLLTAVSAPRRVLVVGGGPAGLEAARVAATRGHHVTLCEALPGLGGQLAIARRAPLRGEIGNIVDWLEAQLDRFGVEVHTGFTADAVYVRQFAPDAVILATGCVPRRDGFQAARPRHEVHSEGSNRIHTSWDLLRGDVEVGETALVLDDLGHYEAIAVVDRLVEKVETVHFVTRFAEPGVLVHSSLSAVPARARFAQHDVRVHAHSWLVSVERDSAVIGSLDSDRTTRFDVDTTILVSGAEPTHPYDLVAGFDGQVAVVGDALSQRFMLQAISDGNLAGREL